ncbi:MAG: SLBB domain-containing protein, partial [Chitinophagaceae bacterium]|nr:SLBB domain-containing protein [Chitinophagaceae bacterium]
SIRITVLGSYKPGTFTVSSLNTLFNALYVSGGPAANGSYREIELLRNNQIERKVDLYKLLQTGSQEDNVRLQENDIIRIPVYKNRVEIAGEVKRPGIFEILPGETVEDLLRFASGFTESAYKASIKVIQLTDKEKKVTDINQDAYDLHSPHTGDYFEVSKILNRYQNRVKINGAVFRPGNFELSPNLTVAQLIRKAEGLREDAFTKRAQIIRLKEDLTPEIISFDVSAVLNNTADFLLKREDEVIISSIFDLKDEYNVSIQGEVRKPGNYKHVENLTLKDLILLGGGFTYAAYPQRIEIARVIKRDTLTKEDVRLSEIIDIKDINDLSYSANNLSLQPFDVVTVRRLPGYLELKSVVISGQVQYPGPYVLASRSERVSDLLKRAGGFAPEAYPGAAFLKRKNENSFKDELDSARVKKIQGELRDSTKEIVSEVSRPYDQIALDLVYIITHPGSDADLILKPEDELFVPRNDEAIKISGQVLSPTQSPYRKGDNVADYISNAGGFTDDARKSKVYVLYPNGKAARTKHFLFVRSYPQVKSGSEIIVPKVRLKVNNKSITETIAVATAVAGLAAVVLGIIQLTK